MRRPVLPLPAYTPGIYGPWELTSTAVLSPDREHIIDRGYFSGLGGEPHYHVLRERESKKIWMVTSLLEQESHLFHVKHATGVVVIVGVGMGMVLKAVAAKPDVTRVIAIDISLDVINFVETGTDFEDWPGREKIEFLPVDALAIKAWPLGQVDVLYVDIWPDLGMYEALPQTQAIQNVIKAHRVGWWGQEIDFFSWITTQSELEPEFRARGMIPTKEMFDKFQLAVKLPSYERSADYMRKTKEALLNFVARVS